MTEEIKKPQEETDKAVKAERAPRRNDNKKNFNRRPKKFADKPKSDLEDMVIAINRVTKVVKGGRQFRFAATVVVGNKKVKLVLV